MAFSSTIVTYGRGQGVVIATGMNTEMGAIADMLEDQTEVETPLKRKLASVGKILMGDWFNYLCACICLRCNLSAPIVATILGSNFVSDFYYSGRVACYSYNCDGIRC